MNICELNELPDLVRAGKIDQRKAIEKISCFITSNYPLFGLHRFDEDFREDVLLNILERGEKIFETYNQNTANFFTYLYSNIASLINTKRKNLAIQQIKESIAFDEEIIHHEENNLKYKEFKPVYHTVGEIPFAYKPKNIQYLKNIFSDIARDSSDKKILVLAMKSAFYITDSQIEKVCKLYNLKSDDFYDVIFYCKERVFQKNQKKKKAQECRNYSYYHHKRCEQQLEKLKESDKENDLFIKEIIQKKLKKHYEKWNKMNQRFHDGFLFLRPTNKTIAELLGICERQVTYYINCARKDFEKENDKTAE